MARSCRFRSLHILAGCALLSGCGGFSSAPEIPPLQRQIDVQLHATQAINPGANGQAQPVKICIIETRLEGWSPPGLYHGTPCSGINPDNEVISINQYILAPLETRHSLRDVPYSQERWLIIAAEFQHAGTGTALIQLKSDAFTDFKPVIRVEGNTLIRLANMAPDISKEE